VIGQPLALLLLLAAPAPATAGIDAPPYRIIHPPELSREAGEVASAVPVVVQRLSAALQAPPPHPATLYLVTYGSASMAGGLEQAMPEWAAGIAMPSEHVVILRADRVGSWRQRQLIGVLAHETAHLLMHEAAGAGAGSMPAWFREGVAANLARDGEWLDFIYLWVSPIPSSSHPLADLSFGFTDAASPVLVRAAYAGSYSFLRRVMADHGAALPARVLAGLREGRTFDEAWSAAAGAPLAADEAAWSASIRGRGRWAALLTSSSALWVALTLLVVLAWLIKRRRGARVMDRWSREEPWE